ncbi:MAG: FAD-binding oxidoreductase [Chloroflexi bacterium]|nr:FAD-binding oxidoreductase [Chloroflexota bacterium]
MADVPPPDLRNDHRNPTGLHVPGLLDDRVVLPGDARYEGARLVANAAIDRRPAAIVLARSVEDIVATVRFAGDRGIRLAVRAGGHSAVGYGVADDAIVLDVSRLDDIGIDAASGTVWVGAGATAGALTAAVHPGGYAVPFGDWGEVGIAGITLGGGVGWLVRRFGMTIDSLLAVELVTAAGERLMASAAEHPDLFWAVRGGGGNFGVATRFRFQLRAVDTVLAGDVIVRATPEVLANLVGVLAGAPDGLTVMPSIMAAPPMPELPEDWHGRLVVFLSFCHSGPIGDDERVVDLLRSLGESRQVAIGRKPYPAMFPEPSGTREAFASGTLFVDELDDAAIRIIERRMASPSSPEALVHLRVLGGAYARVANDATAFAHRDRRAMVWLITPFADAADAPRHEAWTADFEAELRAAGCGSGAYSNFLGRDGPTELRAAYPPATLARLGELKARYDPGNLFRSNLNILPTP